MNRFKTEKISEPELEVLTKTPKPGKDINKNEKQKTKNEKNKTKNEKKKAKSEKRKAKSSGNIFKSVRNFLLNEKVHKITGVFFILFSLFLLCCFTSYLFSWETNKNLMGALGNNISEFFIKKEFGIASYLFILLFFVSGVKLLVKISVLPLAKTFFYCLFCIIWISAALGFFLLKKNQLPIPDFSGIIFIMIF